MKLIQLEAGRETKSYDCPDLPVILGRQPSKGIAIVHPTISREHAKIFERDGKLSVADLNSSNGTFVNGAKVSRADLKPGDTLRLGEVELRIAEVAGSQAAGNTAMPSAAELFGEEGGIQLEETHLSPTVDSGTGGTQIFAPSPPRASAMNTGSAGGPVAPPPRSIYAAQVSRPLDKKRSGNLFTADVGQQSSLRRLLTIVFVILFAVALFYGAMKLTEDVAPERKVPQDEAPSEPGGSLDTPQGQGSGG